MKVGIVMGSDSDLPIMEKSAELLNEFAVPYEMVIASAHRTPEVVKTFVERMEAEGAAAFIAGAGAAAHLPGVIASLTTRPVIGIPIDATPLKGMDALLAIVQMPSGMPVATMAINGAKNAALFALQICSVHDEKVYEKYKDYRAKMTAEVVAKNMALQRGLGGGNI